MSEADRERFRAIGGYRQFAKNAPAPVPGFTAALATEGDRPYCDVTVLINDEDGQITDRAALPWIDLAAAPMADPDHFAKAMDAAPGVLAAQGWRLAGPWTISDNAAYVPAEPMPQLLVSVLDVKGGALGQMPGVTGVWWADTRWLDCTEHLASPSWTPDIDERSAVKAGVVLSAPAAPGWCDCEHEATHEDGWTEVETDGKGGVVSQRRLSGAEAADAEQAYQQFIAPPVTKVKVRLGGRLYTYGVEGEVAAGDVVAVPPPAWDRRGPEQEVEVVEVGSDYDGPLATARLVRKGAREDTGPVAYYPGPGPWGEGGFRPWGGEPR